MQKHANNSRNKTVNSTARRVTKKPSFGDSEMPEFDFEDFFIEKGSAPSSANFQNPAFPDEGPSADNTVQEVSASTGTTQSEAAGRMPKVPVVALPKTNNNALIPPIAALALGYYFYQSKGPTWGIAAAGVGYFGAKKLFPVTVAK